MAEYIVTKVINQNRTYYIIKTQDGEYMDLPSKFLKHRVLINQSSNTIRKLAYDLSHYLKYLSEQSLCEGKIIEMKYSEQQEHFSKYLAWCKNGYHSNRMSSPKNSTCNTYLRSVLSYYDYLYREGVLDTKLKVIDAKKISYTSSVGIKFVKDITSFEGYLEKENSEPQLPETKGNIETLLDHCSSLRDLVIILLLAITGMRLGELLGIHYTSDIDFDRKRIYVHYRRNNVNGALAKNAEERFVCFDDTAADILQIYLSQYSKQLQHTDYLFITKDGKPMTPGAVYSFLRTLKKRTGIKTHPHKLRHYFANERRKAGWDMLL